MHDKAVLILLPPSEGKTAPRRGAPLDLDRLSSPVLTPARQKVVEALVELCATRPEEAATLLDVPSSRPELVDLNADLRVAPTARADRVYTGVLYDALSFATLSAAAKRRATASVRITSSVFGLVSPADRIPAYRLSGDTTLPAIGSVQAHWRDHLADAVEAIAPRGLIVDLRSQTYAAFWRPDATAAARTATVRVLHEHGGVRKVVSHFNKATKGRIVRALLEAGTAPRTPAALADSLRDLGWTVEPGQPGQPGQPGRTATRLDVVVSEV